MNSIMEIIKEFEKPCSCGMEHHTAVGGHRGRFETTEKGEIRGLKS